MNSRNPVGRNKRSISGNAGAGNAYRLIPAYLYVERKRQVIASD